jgi:hypothetical protein
MKSKRLRVRWPRILTALLCLAIPGLFLLNAWEGYRYGSLSDQVADLEQRQKELLERNRSDIAQIAYETSPERVAEKAGQGLGLAPADPSNVTRVQVGAALARGQLA